MDAVSRGLGYTPEEVSAVPEGTNLGLGCGNPQAIASLQPGETVLDLGSGAGFDSFLAARAVGKRGHVIGVDMTPEMISRARAHAETDGVGNVEFRRGGIEYLPVADGTVDVIISNCVINLSPEKARVFREAFRVLRPGGRLAISDIVATAVLPDDMKQDMSLYTGCMAGASPVDDLQVMLQQAGFEDVGSGPRTRSAPSSATGCRGGRLKIMSCRPRLKRKSLRAKINVAAGRRDPRSGSAGRFHGAADRPSAAACGVTADRFLRGSSPALRILHPYLYGYTQSAGN